MSAMSDRELRLEDALNEIMHWALAYPVTVFPEPDMEKARVALEPTGITMDALYGTWARHLLKGVGEIAVESILKARAEGGRFCSLAWPAHSHP
jgi:hypothetical protein